jgi:hypothetical protein
MKNGGGTDNENQIKNVSLQNHHYSINRGDCPFFGCKHLQHEPLFAIFDQYVQFQKRI